ncbi:MAG: hypothetical protein RSE13_07335 [Planktothrix sp. GU0601_MAG3]|nr:MAG: hypothetical protein RSE13_07335 [Planktothrix sp. GU0601_MAG3]
MWRWEVEVRSLFDVWGSYGAIAYYQVFLVSIIIVWLLMAHLLNYKITRMRFDIGIAFDQYGVNCNW